MIHYVPYGIDCPRDASLRPPALCWKIARIARVSTVSSFSHDAVTTGDWFVMLGGRFVDVTRDDLTAG